MPAGRRARCAPLPSRRWGLSSARCRRERPGRAGRPAPPPPRSPGAPARARRSPAADGARDLALGVAPALRVALVVQLLPLAERDRDFRDAALEVQLERHECQPLALHGADQAPDLAPVEEE